jgi:hypothetical protein
LLGIESAHYDIGAAAAARDIVLVSLIADVTRAYLDMPPRHRPQPMALRSTSRQE